MSMLKNLETAVILPKSWIDSNQLYSLVEVAVAVANRAFSMKEDTAVDFNEIWVIVHYNHKSSIALEACHAVNSWHYYCTQSKD